MLYYLLSIAALTIIFWALFKARVVSVCPICAGVVMTWAAGIAALYYGVSWANPLLIGILMGASLGALADKYGSKFGLFWKSSVVLLGLPAIYFVIQRSFWKGVILIIAIGIVTLLSNLSNKKSGSGIKHKKDLFQDCC